MTVSVTIYSSKGAGLPGDIEQESIAPCLLSEYLSAHDPDYAERVDAPLSVTLNGLPVAFERWSDTRLNAGDDLQIQIEPLGFDPFTWFIIAVTVASAGYAIYVASNIPDNVGQSSKPQGSSIYRADLQANTPKKNGTVPEIFGKMPRYPDLITPARRKYIDHEEWLYMGMCVGVGQYSIADADIRIGETPVSNYAADITYDIELPAADCSAIEGNEHWYTNREIGSTSGTSGLELKTESIDSIDGSYLHTFSGTTITQTDGASSPVDWDFIVGERFDNDTPLNPGKFEVTAVSTNTLTVRRLSLVSYSFRDAGGETDVASWVFDPSWTALVSESAVTASASYTAVNGAWSTWINILPETETTDTLEIDIRYPRGLGKYDDQGNLTSHEVVFEYQTKPVGGSSTTGTITKSGATRDERAYTQVVDLGSAIEPMIRFRRVTPEVGDTKYLEAAEIVRVKGKLTAASSYADITTIFFAIRATNAVAQSAEKKLNLDAQRLLPTAAAYLAWTFGEASALTHSAHSEIAAPFIYLTLDSGYGKDDLDRTQLDALQTIWTSRGDTFDAEISDESTLFELHKRIMAVGYAEPTIEGQLITAQRDVARTTYDYLYTPDKILPPGISRPGELYDEGENDGVEIEYFNTSTRQNETVTYTLTAAGDTTNPINPKRIRAFGITDETKAWRFGSIDRRRSHFKPDQIHFTTEMDGLNSTYLSSPAVADDININGVSGFLTSIVGDVVTLDTPISFDGVSTYKIAFGKSNGTMSTLYTATAGATDYEVTLSSTLDFTPVLDGTQELPVFAFGTADSWATHVVVRDIQPQGPDSVKLICEEHIAAIWDDIDGAPS